MRRVLTAITILLVALSGPAAWLHEALAAPATPIPARACCGCGCPLCGCGADRPAPDQAPPRCPCRGGDETRVTPQTLAVQTARVAVPRHHGSRDEGAAFRTAGRRAREPSVRSAPAIILPALRVHARCNVWLT